MIRFSIYELLTTYDVLVFRDGDLLFHSSTKLQGMRREWPPAHYAEVKMLTSWFQ